MSFWPLGRRRKAAEPPTPPAPAEPAAGGLPLVQLWTVEGRRTVAIDAGGGRVTDVLNGDAIVRAVVVEAPPDGMPASLAPAFTRAGHALVSPPLDGTPVHDHVDFLVPGELLRQVGVQLAVVAVDDEE